MTGRMRIPENMLLGPVERLDPGAGTVGQVLGIIADVDAPSGTSVAPVDIAGSGGSSGKIEFYFFNNGAVLVAGDSDWGYLDVACTIVGAQLVTDAPGTMSAQVHTADYPTWDAWTLISGAGPINLSGVNKMQPSVAGWLVDIAAGTYMKIVIAGVPSVVTKATLTLFLEPA